METSWRKPALDLRPSVRRYVRPLTAQSTAELDEYGFFVPSESSDCMNVVEVLEHRATLILAPAWVGKTYTFNGLKRHVVLEGVRYRSSHSLDSDRRASWTPSWWASWKDSGDRAYLFVDALDEGKRRGIHIADVVQCVADLRPEQLDRLRLVMFSRDDRSAPEIRHEIEASLGPVGAAGLRVYELAPVDALEAKKALGSGVDFQNACENIRKSSTQTFAKYIPALRYLATTSPVAGVREVRRGVFENACSEQRAGVTPLECEREDVLAAAIRIATVMGLTSTSSFSLHKCEAGTLHLNDAIPLNSVISRDAGRDLPRTVLLRSAAGGGAFTFRELSVEENLTALGLLDCPADALRLLIMTPAGRVRRDLEASRDILLELLNTDDTERRSAIADAEVVPDSVAIEYLDRLQAAASAADGRIRVRSLAPLEVLSTSGVRAELEERIEDSTVAARSRAFLLDIAGAIGAPGVVPTAVSLAMDPDEPGYLRSDAVYFLCGHGHDEDLRALEPIVTQADGGLRDFPRARLLLELVKRSIVSIDEALSRLRALPTRQARRLILHHIGQCMTRDDAMRLYHAANADNPTAEEQHSSEVQAAIFVALLDKADSSEDDRAALKRIIRDRYDADDLEVRSAIDRRLRGDSELRASLYNERDGNDPSGWPLSWALSPSDAGWLIPLLQDASHSDHAFRDLCLLAQRELPPAERSGIETALERHDAVRFEEHKKLLRNHNEGRRRRHVKSASSEVGELSLSEAVQQILSAEHSAEVELLRALGLVVFSPDFARPANVVGHFDGLEEELRRKVVHAMQRAFERASPTQPPQEGKTFSGAILYEAAAFQGLLDQGPPYSWLSASVISDWLPPFLFQATSAHEAAVRRCLAHHPSATQEACLAAIKRELVDPEPYALIAAELPPDAWSSRFAHDVAHCCMDTRWDECSRAALVRILASRAPEVFLDQIWGRVGASSTNDPFTVGVLDGLLMADPGRGVPAIADKELVLFEGLTVLTGAHASKELAKWCPDPLAGLAILLYSRLPPTTDPPWEDGVRFLSATDRLRDLRDRIPDLLYSMGSGSPAAALAQIERVEPKVHARIRRWRASDAVQVILDELDGNPQPPSIKSVVSVLERQLIRPVRNSDDLLHVLVQTLQSTVGETVAEDVAMLYDRGPERKRLHEDALRTYVRRRLTDLMPWRVAKARISPLEAATYEEARERLRRRTDIIVTAPERNGRLLQVVIEIKWSDNRDVKTSLHDQLVGKYLVEAGRTHGIYVVALTGNSGCIDEQKAFYCGQAAQARETHPKLNVESVVFDARWNDPREGST